MSRHAVRLDFAGSEAHLALAGEIDMNAADDLERTAEQAVAGTPEQIVVDLTQVSFLDSAGLGVLVVLNNAATAKGIPVVLRPGPANVMRVLEIVGLTEVFRTDPRP